MMKHTLLLHIGMPKTGTTALQGYLLTNRSKLQESGWDYPDFYPLWDDLDGVYKAERVKNGNILRGEANGEPIEYVNLDFVMPENVFRLIDDSLQVYDTIISSEDIWFKPGAIVSQLKNRYENIKIIVYLRRQDLYGESLYKQVVKGPCTAVDVDFSDFVIDYNYKEKLDLIADIVGKDNLIVRIYDKKEFSKLGSRCDTISDFVSVLGIKSLDGFKEDQYSSENASTVGVYTEIKRLINRTRNRLSGSYDNLSDDFIKVAIETSNKSEDYGYLSDEERKDLLSRYEAGNNAIAREYLGREELFDNTFDEKQPVCNVEISQFEEKMVMVFAGMLMENAKRMRGYTARIECLERSLSTGKRYVFFGAGGRAKEAISEYGLKPEMILDNNLEKAGTEIEGVKVCHPSELDGWTEYLIVVTPEKSSGLEKWLKEQGLEKNKNYITLNDILYL